jgi:tetrahydromethanopterin S-methyltransferase subunit G
MSDEPDSLVLRYLRRIDERMDRVETRLSELVGRTGLLEQGYAGVSRRLDQIDLRIERIERRLDLVGEHTS